MLNEGSVVDRAEHPGRENISDITKVISEIWELRSIAITKQKKKPYKKSAGMMNQVVNEMTV